MWWCHPTSNASLLKLLSEAGVSYQSLTGGLLAIADQAALLARQFYRNPSALHVSKKSDATPVTEADHAIHRLLYEQLPELLPGVPVLSEECSDEQLAQRLDWDYCWIVDPLMERGNLSNETNYGEYRAHINGVAELGLPYPA